VFENVVPRQQVGIRSHLSPLESALTEKLPGGGAASNSQWDKLQSVSLSANTCLGFDNGGLSAGRNQPEQFTTGGDRQEQRLYPAGEVRQRNTCGT
jgi:hypothetical protein